MENNKRKQERKELNRVWFVVFILISAVTYFIFSHKQKENEIVKCGKNPDTIVVTNKK